MRLCGHVDDVQLNVDDLISIGCIEDGLSYEAGDIGDGHDVYVILSM